MRFTAVSIICTAVTLGAAAPPGVLAQENPRCESTGSMAMKGEVRDIVCPLKASTTPQRFNFSAHFSGSHDDTAASIAPTLDGAPLTCDEGSKTRLMAEDGEVSLNCRFAVSPRAGTEQVLRVVVSFFHAQYADFELVAD